MLFNKKAKYEMDMEIANATLQNILAACDKAPNTIPFDKLILRQKFNSKVYTLPITIMISTLFLTLIAPLFIVPISGYLDRQFPPEEIHLVEDYVKDNVLHLKFSENDRILYHAVYLETLDGQSIESLSYDMKEGVICFPYYDYTESNIYIPLYNGETLHFLISPIS